MSNSPHDPRSQKPKSPAQRASDANRLHQTAVNDKTPRPNDRRTKQDGETADDGMTNDNRPVGVNRR